MEKTLLIQLLTPIVIAIIGGIWTIVSYSIQQSYNRSQIYFTFRTRFREFQDKLPVDVNLQDIDGNYIYEPKKEQKEEYYRLIEVFWWLVFDEWFICCKQCRSCKSLWKKYYAVGVLNALVRKEWRETFYQLAKVKDSFFGLDEEFIKEIDKIYYKKYRKHLL